MSKNKEKQEKLHFNRDMLVNLLKLNIKAYQFTHKNQNPKSVVIPLIKEVDGVPVEYETAGEEVKSD